jgi:hypothetical protein
VFDQIRGMRVHAVAYAPAELMISATGRSLGCLALACLLLAAPAEAGLAHESRSRCGAGRRGGDYIPKDGKTGLTSPRSGLYPRLRTILSCYWRGEAKCRKSS